MASPHLRTVEDDEGAEGGVVDVRGAVESASSGGSALETLVALRVTISRQLDAGVLARDLASLSKRLMDIMAEIATLTAQAEKDGGDDGEAEDEDFDPESI